MLNFMFYCNAHLSLFDCNVQFYLLYCNVVLFVWLTCNVQFMNCQIGVQPGSHEKVIDNALTTPREEKALEEFSENFEDCQ